MHTPQETTSTDLVGEASANPGYALGQMAKAFATSSTHADAHTRKRAQKKIADWIKIYEGMLAGALQVGSRTPVAGVPPWVTLEVSQGGFTTGEFLSGGALQEYEQELLSRLPGIPAGRERAALNSFYLGDAGIAELRRMLASGAYRVNVPEEGALLVAAWLLEHGQLDQVQTLLDAIGPFLSRLRFYPMPDPQAPAIGAVVHLQDVGQTIRNLEALRVPELVLAQREAIQVWTPLYDRVAELFFETVEGPLPSLRTGADGKPLRGPQGNFIIEGGWPCQRYPDGWPARARAALNDYRRLRKQNRKCGKPENPTQNFAILRGHLETCIKKPRRLTGRDVGMIRLVLASIVTKRGVPSSPQCQRLRQTQAEVAARPTRVDFARVLVGRLAALPAAEGLESLDAALMPVSPAEADRYPVKTGQLIPKRLGVVLRRCLTAPVETLVEMGIISSAEVLARILLQLTAQVRAAGLADPDLRRLYTAIYRAFRRRRSLLLLNLQSQVKLGELPWVRAIDAHRQDNLNVREQARLTLEQLVTLAVTAFPQQILPNKLLQEVRALAEAADLQVPLVDEVAADIFMGTFSEKFLRAAQKAGELLQGTLYARYYGIDYATVWRIDDVQVSGYGPPTSPQFAQLCAARAGETATTRMHWSVARNGTIIEQEQILTTHNLAVLFDSLGLTTTLRLHLGDLARRCFAWICRRQQQKIDPWKARLQMVKNTAYGWRQMVFFLALLPADAVEEFLGWASDHLAQQRPEYQMRFRPALEGLSRSARGQPIAEGTCQFLGWTTQKHWLLA
jgi:hypothetical protein